MTDQSTVQQTRTVWSEEFGCEITVPADADIMDTGTFKALMQEPVVPAQPSKKKQAKKPILNTKSRELRYLPELPLAKTAAIGGIALLATFYGGWNVAYSHNASATQAPISAPAQPDAAGKVQAPNQ